MRIARIAATTLLSVAALCIATVSAHGEPTIAAPGISGADRGVDYSIALAPDRSAVTTTLAAGHFELAGGAVNVIAPSGELIGALPLVYQAADRVVTVVPEVNAAGTELTVRPADRAEIVTPTAQVVALQSVANAGSIVAGALIGCVVGAVIGFFFFIVGAIVGCGVGGLLGAIIAGDQP
ncbi:hypothetical protein GL305_22660 [Nocardia seriolae]|nr:hypothetical protein [Nocardia seriolae]APA99076.1 hypothetical protein NS506_05030 [Nocardia seriolae]MTJ63961.1 hypothetical protein [Nocardia seriolae]MTJ70993.1 hypothetical protein [Nocardia seriolae]MTJ88685.1 hypothetical protein [Nocardia seriolae]MTK32667.1 hypothetical protein [Nocardia seriolae]